MTAIVNTNNQRTRKLKRILLVLALCFTAILLFFIYTPIIIPNLPFGLVFFLAVSATIVYFSITKKYYNWNLFFLFLTVLAIIFKYHRMPFSQEFFIVGFSGLACISFFSAIYFLKMYKHRTFLRLIGFFSSIILTIVALGLLWKNMHWPLANIILYVGLILFVPFLMAFVFTLPNSDYINWNRTDREIFFKVIIIPMIFVYILCALMIVFPKIWTDLIRQELVPFYMVDFELFNMPGLF